MLWIFAIVSVVGLIQSRTLPPAAELPDETEWDCSQDHAPSEGNPRNFLQSPNGFGEGANVYEATCPTRLQVFSSVNGVCRCLYREDLRVLLEQDCQVRVPPSVPIDEYDLLVPNLDEENIEDLYRRQTCLSVLPDYIAAVYRAANVIPLFFNQTGCRCDWVIGVDRSIESGAVAPAGGECERLIDQNFTNIAISSDEVGSFFQVFPSQANLTLIRGGQAFSGMSEATWRVTAVTFKELSIILRFDAENSGSFQCVATNFCANRGLAGGFFDLQFDPSARTYSLQFFSEQVARCSVPSASGVQNVQIRFSEGAVSLIVNNVDCDVSALNPIPAIDEEGNLMFDTKCPVQVGGQVFADPAETNFGQPTNNVANLNGVFYRFMVLRNCFNPPQMVMDRIAGTV